MLSELEAAAIEAALKLLFEAVTQKKITQKDVTDRLNDMIWKTVREEV